MDILNDALSACVTSVPTKVQTGQAWVHDDSPVPSLLATGHPVPT